MSSDHHASYFPHFLLLLATLLFMQQRAEGNDRFLVPVPDSPPPAPPPAPSSSSNDSGGSSSSSGNSSYSDSSGSSGGGHQDSNDRFIVPVPRDASHKGGSPHGGGTYHGGGYTGYDAPYYDDYWGGSYYWGGRYYYWGGLYYSPFGGTFGRSDNLYEPPRSYRRLSPPDGKRLSIFFPPEPPPLGVAAPPPPPQPPFLVAPAELEKYITDPFYAPLSSRLAKRNLTTTLRRRLDAYADEKASLQQELRQHLDAVALAAPESRQRALEEFSRIQTPRIVALEARGEQLRGDLLRAGLVGALWGTGNWNEHRGWHLGPVDGSTATNPTLGFQVVRAAVFYQEGLSPAQRRLLREVAMELQADAYRPRTATAQSADEHLVFFFPETARIRRPSHLATETARELAAFEHEKAALKEELRSALYRLDAAPEATRAAALRQLAQSQGPRIVALEAAAESIRRQLTSASPAPSLADLPPELAARIIAWHENWNALQDSFAAQIAEINRSYGFGVVTFDRRADDLSAKTTLRIHVQDVAESDQIRHRLQATIGAFNRTSAQQTAELRKAGQALRNEIVAFSTTHPDALAGTTVDDRWKQTMEELDETDHSPEYRDYRTAVLEPGLSPEQRRLLFDLALQKLRLPLPGGEFQP